MKPKNSAVKNMLIGLALGCVAGGLAALFAAPQSGIQTRKMIQVKGGEMIDRSANSLQRTSDNVKHAVVTTRQRAGLSVVKLGNQIGSQLLGIKE